MMTEYPLISIIVPIYNVEKYIDRCVNSLIKQDYSQIEIILIDDCSTDNSAEIAKTIALQNSQKCFFVQREKNGGLSAARNTGIKHAKGEWLSFVDSDDWVTEDYVSTLYNKAAETNSDVVMGNAEYVYDNGERKSADAFGILSPNAGKKEIIALCRSYACGRLFKKELFTNIQFPEDIKRSEDIGTIIPILTKADKIAILDKPIYNYYQRETSISNNNKNIDLDFYPKTLQRMFDLSSVGFEEELEYRSIHEMLYGMVYLIVDSGKPMSDYKNHIAWFNKKFPRWRANKYLDKMPKAKRVFVQLAGNNHYRLLRILVKTRKVLNK